MSQSNHAEQSTSSDSGGNISGVRPVKSAARAVDLLEYLSLKQNKPMRLREISEELNLPRSSVYALLRTLTDRGWVDTDASGTFYTIGIRALLAGTTYLDADPYLRVVQPFLTRLNETLDETVHFGRIDGTDIVYLATRDSSQSLRLHNRVGRRLPAHTTALGKAVLAERDLEIPSQLEAFTPNTIIDRDALIDDLTLTRKRGFAIDEEENSLGVRCYGFALHYQRPVRDAISCSIPLVRINREVENKVLTEMRRVAREIERLISQNLYS